jgi:hypothetical protein
MSAYGPSIFLAMLTSVTVAACSGNGVGLDSSGRPLSEAGTGSVPLTATFDAIQSDVFTPICTACHAGAGAPQGLRLDAANSYNLLVGIPSMEVPSILRVKPGDPDNSYIIQKLEGRAAVGARMPFGGPPLPPATIAAIRQWIADGAMRPMLAIGMLTFEIASAAPADGDLMTTAPTRLVIGFTRELNATRVDHSTVRLQRVDAATPNHSPVYVPVDVAVPSVNGMAIVVTPRQPLEPGSYRIVLGGEPGNELRDLSGQALAMHGAELSGAQPVASFTVEAPQ